jgi:tight adherence protein C
MTHQAYRYLIVVFSLLVLGLPSYWLATRPSRPTSRLGMRGKKRQQGLLRSPSWAGIEPLVRWLGVRVNGVLPLSLFNKLDLRLTHAGDYLGMTADEAFGSMLASAVVGAIVAGLAVGENSGLSAGLCAIPFGILVGGAIPYFMIDSARVNRLRTIHRSLPFAIDLLALTMSAGFDFPGALRQLVERARLPEVLTDEFEYMQQQLQLGHTRAAVLREFAVRAPADLVKEFCFAVIQAEERGNPVAATIEIQARTARDRRTALAEKAAEDMKTKMVIPTFAMVAVLMILIGATALMMFERLSTQLNVGQ